MAEPAAPVESLPEIRPPGGANGHRRPLVAPVKSGWGRFAAHPLAVWILGALLAVLTWPIVSMEPSTGLDQSWAMGLHMAAHQRLDFGHDLIFTYGPLGFMRVPMFAYLWTTRLAFLATGISQILICATLIWGVRRITGSLLAAILATLALAPLLGLEPGLLVVGMGAAVALLEAEHHPRATIALAVGLGALGGYEIVGKLNSGVVVVALGAVAVALRPSPRRPPAVAWAAGLVAMFLASWVGAHQSLGAVPAYLRASLQVISGYSQAMGYEFPHIQWQWWAAGLLAGLGVFAIVRVRADRRRRAALLALWAVLTFTSFKSGFVRHDSGHANLFFATVLGGLIVLPLRGLGVTSAVLAVLVALVACLASSPVDPGTLVAPVARTGRLIDQATLLANGRKTGERIARARARLQGAYRLDPATYDAMRGGGVHIDPWEASVAWAERLPWKPLPVFQSYTAYTRQLDEDNAAALSDARGPQRILRQAGVTIDGRNMAWDSPAARRALLCHFRAVVTSGGWQALRRVPNRCGTPVQLASVATGWGRTVKVPPAPAGDALYVNVNGAAVGGLERLRAFFDRALPRSLTLNGKLGYRLVPGTAADGLILHVPAGADFPKPFQLDQRAHTLTAFKGTSPHPPGRLVFDFFALPVH